MNKNTWDGLALILCVMDFLGGATSVVYGFVKTFTNPVYGWLEILVGVFLLFHAHLILHSRVEHKDVQE